MNLLLAIAFGLELRIVVTIHPDSAYEWVTESVSGRFVWAFVTLNLLLMCFNLIPMHPLDGGKLLSNVLPFQQSVRFDRFFYQFGPMILLFVIFSGSGVLGTIIGPPVDALLRLIVGRI